MRKVLILSMVLSSFLAFGAAAAEEMAKEGKGSGKSYFIATTFQVLAMEKERVQINYEGFGIFAADNGQGLFHNMSQHVVGGMHISKGNIDDSGFVEATLTTGEKFFMTYKASGKMGKPTIVKGTFTYVGGTGKLSGIEGGGEFTRYTLQPPATGKAASFSVVKSHWKLPEAKK